MASRGSGICVVVFDNQQKLTAAVRNVIIESVKSFRELTSCLSFLQRARTAIVLITTTLDHDVLEEFDSLESVEAIFILSIILQDLNTFPRKVIGVYRRTESLLRSLSETLDSIEIQLNARSLLFDHQLDRRDNTEFYFYHIWKNENRRKTNTKDSFVKQARLDFQSNDQIQSLINDFEVSYKPSLAVLWLDTHRHVFPYHLLISHALRSHDQEILSLAQFFLRHLDKQMKPAPTGQAYLGTKLPAIHVRRLQKYRRNDAVAFQCFLRVTQSRANAFFDATKSSRRENLINVLFKIETNNVLCLPMGETFLIDMATPFRIQYITRTQGNNGRLEELVIIKLIALNTNERERLFQQFKRRQENSKKNSKVTPRIIPRRIRLVLYAKIKAKANIFFCLSSRNDEALADEHISRREWFEAAVILVRIPNPTVRVLNKHGYLLCEYLDDLPGALKCHQQASLIATDRARAESFVYLAKVYQKMKRYEEAFGTYSKALKWFENEEKQDLAMIARCFVEMSTTQRARQRLDDALDYAERALAIREHQIQPRNDFDVATCLGNIGNILHDQGDIDRELSYALRAVELLNVCGQGDPRLAAALNNLGALYQSAGDTAKSREYFDRALANLPEENHPHRKSTLANIDQLNMIEESITELI